MTTRRHHTIGTPSNPAFIEDDDETTITEEEENTGLKEAFALFECLKGTTTLTENDPLTAPFSTMRIEFPASKAKRTFDEQSGPRAPQDRHQVQESATMPFLLPALAQVKTHAQQPKSCAAVGQKLRQQRALNFPNLPLSMPVSMPMPSFPTKLDARKHVERRKRNMMDPPTAMIMSSSKRFPPLKKQKYLSS